ncbi:hypothetical protein HYS50_00885 [Candidatus Woesearchaeota archaeon]|nr:hypothetical protein [Candidatus Woesearchaeota archaeon]
MVFKVHYTVFKKNNSDIRPNILYVALLEQHDPNLTTLPLQAPENARLVSPEHQTSHLDSLVYVIIREMASSAVAHKTPLGNYLLTFSFEPPYQYALSIPRNLEVVSSLDKEERGKFLRYITMELHRGKMREDNHTAARAGPLLPDADKRALASDLLKGLTRGVSPDDVC